jgi:polyisoprenoid-binding protein YceI
LAVNRSPVVMERRRLAGTVSVLKGATLMAQSSTWEIDPAHSTVEFAVKHMMFTTVRGRFKDVKGTIRVDEQNPNRSTVEVEICRGEHRHRCRRP